MTHPSSNFTGNPAVHYTPTPPQFSEITFPGNLSRHLYKKLANTTTTSTISVSTFLILIYFHRLFSMANYSRATGEAQASTFVTLSSKEFYSNQRESFRLCVTAVRGTRKLNLSKFWFNSEQGMWLPTGKNFYFSKEAWESLVKQITSLNTAIQKTGLFGMRFHFS